MASEGGPRGGKEGVAIMGEEVDELMECAPVKDRRPDELELDEPNGRLVEVVVRVTVRLIGLAVSGEGRVD